MTERYTDGEYTLSDGVEDACTQRYFLAKLASMGIWSLFCHHHRRGLTELRIAGKLV